MVSDTGSKIRLIRPELWTDRGLLIGEIKSPITMTQFPLTNKPIRWVHNHEGKQDQYCTQPPLEHANGLLPCVDTFPGIHAPIVMVPSLLWSYNAINMWRSLQQTTQYAEIVTMWLMGEYPSGLCQLRLWLDVARRPMKCSFVVVCGNTVT
jgi:hypothetical protein